MAGSVTYEGKDCHKIILTDPNYGFVNYTIKAGETIWKIAEAKAIPEYKVKELNNWMDYDDMVAGKTIKIPTAYAKVTTLYIDKSNNLPIYQKMEDDKGMYETYEFKELKVNPTFTATAFDFK
ncbi:MAG: LysM peptidoglycan-binding domain-containing protein [Bacteroidetes bacterium]|nr:LysM peptidoglycan-binding domain-containing protein [Bacteroidota bacterium]